VRNGANTFFLWDMWLDGGVLKHMFSHFFYHTNNEMAYMADMNSLGWSEGSEAWNQLRRKNK